MQNQRAAVMIEAVISSLLIMFLSIALLFFVTFMYRRWYLDIALADAARYFSVQMTTQLGLRARCGASNNIYGQTKLRAFLAANWGIPSTAETFSVQRSSSGKCILLLRAQQTLGLRISEIFSPMNSVNATHDIPIEDPCYACQCT